MQYTIIAEPAKNLWYPMWREKDQDTWKHFTAAGELVSRSTQLEAQEYLDKWSRTFAVLTISRPYLISIGLSAFQVNTLTDEGMQALTDTLQENILHAAGMDFDEEVKFIARLVLAENH